MGGMSAEQIYNNFKNGAGTKALESFAEVLVQLRRSYEDRAMAIKKIQERMESGWTGDAGMAAVSGAGPLVPALQESAANMDRTFMSVTNQAQAWNQTANSVEPVPPVPEKPSWWDNAITLGGASDNYEKSLAEHNRAAQHNVDVMKRYEAMTSANQDFPRSYTTLSPSGVPIKIETTSPSAVSTDVSATPEVRGAASGAPAGAGAATGAAPVVGAAPYPGRPGAGPIPGGGGAPVQPNVPSGSGGTATPTPGYAGAAPVGVAPGQGQDTNRRNTNKPGAARTGTNTGRAGSRLYGGGRGATPIAGGQGGQGGAGARIAAGDAPRGGNLGAAPRATGTGPIGGAAAALSDAGRGAVGGAAARGAGMAPMGAPGAGRGQGDEDKEHQRASYLQENDPDEAFIGDLGKTAPPVIGQ